MTDEEILQDIEQNIKWFCERIVEPIPLNNEDKDKIMKRMILLGWLRQSEYETYQILTKED